MNNANQTFILPCHAGSIRGLLKHTYLTNTICLKTQPEKLMTSMLYVEEGVLRYCVIRDHINELLRVMESPDCGFSPAQLIDRLPPFNRLSDCKKQRMKDRIHRRFSEEFHLVERKERLKGAASGFLEALESFLAVASGGLTEGSMEKVQGAARALISELESLPKGIWLWNIHAVESTRC